MGALREAWARLVSFSRKGKRDREFDEELATHIELATEEHLRRGKSPAEARRLAMVELGGVESAKELHRDARGLAWLDGVVQDLRYAVRMMRRSPGFTAVAVLSLALGIGANTAIFTLIESVLWQPIPVKNPGQLKLLSWESPGPYPRDLSIWGDGVTPWGDDRATPDGSIRHTAFTWSIYEELQGEVGVLFDDLFGFRELGRITAAVDGSAEAVNCFLVSDGFYHGMQVSPVIGRPVGPGDDVGTPEGAVVVISYEYWTRRFAGDPAVIGKKILLNQVPVTIIGVNPAYFTGVVPGSHFEIWAPLHLQPQISPQSGDLFNNKKFWWLSVMGRLKRSAREGQARSALEVVLQRQIDVDFPGPNAEWRPRLELESGARGMDHLTGRYGRPLLVLLSLAGLVLLIACANVANLLLAKSALRQREMSLRLALGAGRWRIVRQLLTEGLLLACLAGIAGVACGYWTRNGIPALLGSSWTPSPFEAAFNPRVLVISIGITFLTGILFSLAPAWQTRRMEANEGLKDGGRGTAGLSKLRSGRLLVVFQVALSLLLLVGAGLLVKTLTNLKAVPIGFNPERVLLFALDPPALGYPNGRAENLFVQLRERVSGIPGVQSATFSALPLLTARASLSNASVTLPGREPVWNGDSIAHHHEVGRDFFETMGIPMLYGRRVDDGNDAGETRRVVVNQAFGAHFFQAVNPIGKTFTDHTRSTYEIVGVCADVRDEGLRYPAQRAFFTHFQSQRRASVTFEVKIAGDAASIVEQIRQGVRSFDSDLYITDVRMQEEQIEATLSQERLLASLVTAFGVLALLLACIGIYGVTAYGVARRTNEIGIRVALGAQPRRVAWMVMRETLFLTAAGVVVGVPAVMAVSRFAESFLYGLEPNDAWTISAAVFALASAATIAGYLPARRAAQVDPMTALRQD